MSNITPQPTMLAAMTGAALAANIIAGTAAETAFAYSWALPANTIVSVGQKFENRFGGIFSTTLVAPTLQGKIKVNGATLLDTGAISALVASATNLQWSGSLDLIVMALSGTTATLNAILRLEFFTLSFSAFPVSVENASMTLDTSIANIFSKTAQWSTANANNSITLRRDSVNSFRGGF